MAATFERGGMELYQLRTFLAVADIGHLTRASERLHLSQPAVSAHIKALEEGLGVRLFDRGPGGMTLTPAGAHLQQRAAKVVVAAEELKQAASSLSGEIAGHLRIGTLSDPEFIRVGDFLGEALERHPLLDLELHYEVSGEALEGVRNGDLDASFYFGELTAPGVDGLRLCDMVYRVVAPASWAERVRTADWSEIAALPWILTPAISTHNQMVSKLFGAHAVQPTKLIEADQESVISSLVAAGLGLSLMREGLAIDKQRVGQVCIWTPARLSTTLWFVYQAERTGDPLIGSLLGVLRDVWALDGARRDTSAEPTPSAAAGNFGPLPVSE